MRKVLNKRDEHRGDEKRGVLFKPMKNHVYVGFNRPVLHSLHPFILNVGTELDKRGMVAVYPKSSARLADAMPKDGFWGVEAFKLCKAALFVFDQNCTEIDSATQLGFVRAIGLPVFCILVRHSVCRALIAEYIVAYGLPLHETWDSSLSGHLIETCFPSQ